jgi:hypothetical protein
MIRLNATAIHDLILALQRRTRQSEILIAGIMTH